MTVKPWRQPNTREAELDYLDACLSDPAVIADYPDLGKRFDYAQASWDKWKKTNKYDPNQARDQEGQWSRGGGSGSKEDVKYATNRRGQDVEVLVNPRPNTLEQQMRDAITPEHGVQELRVVRLKDGTVYTFDAMNGTHDEITNALGKSSSLITDRAFIKTLRTESGAPLYSGISQVLRWLKEGLTKMTEKQITLSGTITKLNEDRQIAYGWFSVIELNGAPVVDLQGDVIDETTLVDAVHDFMRQSRAGKVMHDGPRAASVLESIVLTKDVQAALGISLDRVGWFGGMEFPDPTMWAKVKSGGFKGFSIGGYANKVEN